MLTQQHLAIIRAALRFWKEEIAIHEANVARPYFDIPNIEPPTVAEIESLIRNLETARYALYDSRTGRLKSTETFEYESALALVPVQEIATVLISA